MISKVCVVIVAVVALALPASAAAGTISVSPASLKFGKEPYDSFTTKSFTITNTGRTAASIAIESTFVPDDFSPGQPGSTCPWFEPTILQPGQSCTHIVGYYADSAPPFLGHRRIELNVVARNSAGRTLASKKVIATAMAVAPAPVLALSPDSLSFGEQPYETFETRTLTVTNVASQGISLTSDAGLPDDFSHLIDSTCGLGERALAPGESCTHVIGFRPTPFFGGPQTATLVLTARDGAGATITQVTVPITGTGV
jgi:hypothetical protein